MRGKRVLPIATCFALVLANALTCNMIFAEAPISDFSAAREFKGVASPLITCNILSGFNDNWRGMITSTAYPGDIFEGPEKDSHGNVIKEGDILFTIDKKARQLLLDAKLAKLASAKDKYERDLKAAHAKKKQEIEQDKDAYLEAMAEVKQHEYLVNLCTIRAPFDGIVNSVKCVGWLSGEPAVMEISQLIPMGIEIEMDRELANQIKPTTPIAIYPDPSVSKEVWGIARGNTILTEKGIKFLVENHKVETEIAVNGKKVTVINLIYPILPFNYKEDRNTLSVNSESIFKDEKGSFVWLAVGQKDLTTKGLDNVFPVKKVYIETLGKSTFDNTFIEYTAIKDSKELAFNDITLGQNPKNLNDGDLITVQDDRYVFMPGDKVRVVIGPNPLNNN